MEVNSKLHRLKKHIKTGKTKSHLNNNHLYKETSNEESQKIVDVPHLNEWKNLQAEPFYFDYNYSIIREVTYPLDHKHGVHRFSEIFQVHEDWQKVDGYHPLSTTKSSIYDMIFFDTETTGLHGGTGTYIFLLGYAKFLKDKVIVRQHFLPDPSAEVALYQGFLMEVKEYINFAASYNGKAFDWPQVRTRHTLVRNEVPKLPAFGHFDLLHTARRLFRHRLSSCKLSLVEKEILKVNRKEDTPGYLAPMLYFDFLQEKHPEYIEGVLSHNEWDVLSLITLYINLSKRVLESGSDLRERMEIGKWYEQYKEWPKAEWCFRKVLNETNDASIYSEYAYRLAHVLKKLDKVEEATSYFERALDVELKGPYQYEAAIELAKYFEHREKDLKKALEFAQEAACIGNIGKDDIEKRINRLQRKIKNGK